jgi:hypothetical protein
MFQDYKDLLSAFHAHGVNKQPITIELTDRLPADGTTPGQEAMGDLPCYLSAIGVSTTRGTARVNIWRMVKPLCRPYNDLHYAALAIMLRGEELANTRAVRCKP